MASRAEHPWLRYGTPDPGSLDDFLRSLGRAACRPVSDARPATHHFLDSFDWRLYLRGWALLHHDSTLQLIDRGSSDLLAERPVDGLRAPFFYWDLEHCPLRHLLEPVLSVRALLLIVSLTGSSRSYEARHPKSGTLWRMEHRSLRLVRRRQEKPFLEIVRLRGASDLHKGHKWWDKTARKAGLHPLPPTLLETACTRAGIRPASYSSKINVALEPDLPALDAGFLLARHLLKTMKVNVAGIRQDIDTEFLHDFRVAVRRTRSLLGLMGKVFPPEVVIAAKDGFKRLGRATGPLRDLDVALLRYPEYREMLPEDLHDGLREIFAVLRRDRAAAFTELERRLAQDDLLSIIQLWESFLADPEAARDRAPKKSRKTIGHLARRLLSRRIRSMIEQGELVLAGGGAETVHDLRIGCKKLRYALEFFSSVFTGRDVPDLVRRLKKLQNELGRFNDLTVQLADLRRFMDPRHELSDSSRANATAGALIQLLSKRRDDLHRRILERSRRFAGCRALDRFR